MIRSYLIRALQALLVALWAPAVAFAGVLAATGSDASPLNVPPVLLWTCMGLSSLAGATTLLLQIIKELRANADAGTPDKRLLHPWINATSHMLGSWLAGAFFFLICMSQQANVWMLLATVLVAAFGGATMLDRYAVPWLASRLPVPPAGPPAPPPA